MRRYRTHVENIGWMDWVGEGAYAGTTGKALRMEAIQIDWDTDVEYRVHVQDIGWTGWVKNGEVAGTVGQKKRIEAIQIKGTNIWYHLHVENFGWMDWATGGASSGTEGLALRAEAIQIVSSPVVLGVDTDKEFVFKTPDPVPSAPAKVLNGITVGLNAGHGGSDPGAVGNLRESDINLAVCLETANRLSALGAGVVLTRTDDSHLYLSERCDIVNGNACDIYISNHHNASEDESTAYSMGIAYPGSQMGVALSDNVISEIATKLGTPNNGTLQRDDYDVSYSDMPAVITEAWFVTNPDQCHRFANSDWCQREAQGIVDGVRRYFDV